MSSEKKKHIAIIGRAKSNTEFDWDSVVPVWGFDDFPMRGFQRMPDALFEMHHDALDTDRYEDDYKHWLCQNHDFPIWMPRVEERVPASASYPLHAISALFMNHLQVGGNHVTYFFTSTACYAIAMALWQGYREIELYGVDLVSASDRDAIFFWMGKATGMGIEILLPASSKFFDVPLYGANKLPLTG